MKYMRFIVTAGLAVLLANASLAHGGSYVSFGLGTESALSSDVLSQMSVDEISAGRLAAGYRVGPLAIEAGIVGTGLRESQDASQQITTASLGVDLKYFMSLAGTLEGYARGGLSNTWVRTQVLSNPEEAEFENVGRAYAFGGGLQFTFGPVPLARASIWLDYTHQWLDQSDSSGQSRSSSEALGGAANVVTLGVTVGF
ncbi:MAG: hypothetical protein MJE77_38840 [Proteobacteria bacterium]|nr:hypothetical protein [Pseudomonadota bacterium]